MKLNSNQNRNKNSSENTELYITDDKTNSFWDFLKISWQKQTQLLSGASPVSSVPPPPIRLLVTITQHAICCFHFVTVQKEMVYVSQIKMSHKDILIT